MAATGVFITTCARTTIDARELIGIPYCFLIGIKLFRAVLACDRWAGARVPGSVAYCPDTNRRTQFGDGRQDVTT